jgi:hypothetical protein
MDYEVGVVYAVLERVSDTKECKVKLILEKFNVC